jgi:hypothetical protein
MIAIIFTMYPEEYEIPSHYMEYSAQILITLLDFVFIINYVKSSTSGTWVYKLRHFEIGLAAVTLVLSILQFLVYTDVIPTEPGGERSGHFFEFSIEAANAAFVLWFAIISYLQMDTDAYTHYQKMHSV